MVKNQTSLIIHCSDPWRQQEEEQAKEKVFLFLVLRCKVIVYMDHCQVKKKILGEVAHVWQWSVDHDWPLQVYVLLFVYIGTIWLGNCAINVDSDAVAAGSTRLCLTIQHIWVYIRFMGVWISHTSHPSTLTTKTLEGGAALTQQKKQKYLSWVQRII